MRLLEKTARTYLLFSTLLLVLASALLFLLLSRLQYEEVDEKLLIDMMRLAKKLETGAPVIQLPPLIEVERLPRPASNSLIFKDTLLFDSITQETEHFREVRKEGSFGGKPYRLTLREVILEPHDYLGSIGLALGIFLGMIIFGLHFLNLRISERLWRPFFQNLEAVKSFSVAAPSSLRLKESDIAEFRELKIALEELAFRALADYRNQKEFTQNAAHEIQTPLTIIQAHLEEALQSPNLTKKQAGHIEAARSAASRLSQLNHALLLLAKIETGQFNPRESVSISEKLEEHLALFSPLMNEKDLEVERILAPDVQLPAHPFLIDTLLFNLLSNAVRHNRQGGKLKVELDSVRLRISNTGPPLGVLPDTLFERFAKADPGSKSPGLGLAIVRSICETFGWIVEYTAEEDRHQMEVRF